MSYMYAKHLCNGDHTFWYICLPSRDYYNVRLPYAKFLSVTWEVNTRRRIFFFTFFLFLNLDEVTKNSTPGKFAFILILMF